MTSTLGDMKKEDSNQEEDSQPEREVGDMKKEEGELPTK